MVAGDGAAAAADAGPASITKLAGDASLTARRAQADPKCQPTDLGIHYAGGQGATAMAFDYFQFVNVSRHQCHLFGYPGVAVYDRAGRRLHVNVGRLNSDARPVREVHLRPAGRAIFTIETAAERAPKQHCV